ncbi:type I-B CRISPR-associated endonuclease Cas1b [Fervidobacterium thailandense]|nr:type I-B CRISPR-associated endonuclease Cas1b [Fervidobacterium thailandense]
MKPLYLFSSGRLERKNNTISFVSENEERKYIPVENLTEIYIFGEVDLNKRVLEFLTEKEITLHFFNYYGYYVGSYYPREHYNSSYVLTKQVEKYLNPTERLKIAKKFLIGATKNMLRNIKEYSEKIQQLSDFELSIESLFRKILDAEDIEQLMGIEANIRQTYYETFDLIVDTSNLSFEKRTKRPPENELNALISFGNSLLYTAVLSQIYQTHLDPRIGYLHTNNHRRFTLNLDIAEVFKPVLVDRTIFTLLNRKQITKKDFVKGMNGVFLAESGKKTFVQEFHNRLETSIYSEKLKRNVSYRSLIRIEVYKLERHIIDDQEYQPFVRK